LLVPAKLVKGKIELLIRPMESEVPDDLKNGKNKVADAAAAPFTQAVPLYFNIWSVAGEVIVTSVKPSKLVVRVGWSDKSLYEPLLATAAKASQEVTVPLVVKYLPD